MSCLPPETEIAFERGGGGGPVPYLLRGDDVADVLIRGQLPRFPHGFLPPPSGRWLVALLCSAVAARGGIGEVGRLGRGAIRARFRGLLWGSP